MSVLAFDAEISGLSLAAKTPAAAEIRYEFWKIGLEKLKEGSLEPNGHPLLDSMRILNSNTLQFLSDSLNGRRISTKHPDTLKDFDLRADATLLPIYSAIDDLLASKCDSLAQLARAQFTIRRLRGLQATLNGKRMQLNDFIPTQMQLDRVKLYDIVRLFVEHAQRTLESGSFKRHKLFVVEAFCAHRWLKAIEAANFDLRAKGTLKTCTKHDGLLPLLVFTKSLF